MPDNDSVESHSSANTKEVAEAIRDLLKDDDESDLEAYDKIVSWPGDAGSQAFKLDNNETDLTYMVVIVPLKD